MNHTDVRVVEVVAETDTIRTLRLVRTDGNPFPPWRAGAHIDVDGPTGIVRQYSLCGDPRDTWSLLVAVKREPDSRGGSLALHGVAAGEVLRVGEPRNLLALSQEAEHHVLVAGGVGLTPLLSMARELHARGADFTLHYFARSEKEAAFVEHLGQAGFADRVHFRFGTCRSERPALLRTAAASASRTTHVYTCGPEGFMDQVYSVFAPVVGQDQVHREHFTPAGPGNGPESSFEVELDTGEVFEVPAGRSILSVLNEHGVDVFTSCEEGICGSCVSGVLEGVPDHRDRCLSASDRAAGDQMALCVSRALSPRLRIELY